MDVHDCENHAHCRRITFRCILSSIVVIGLIAAIVIVWAIYNPTNPRFELRNVAVLAFNVTQPNLLTSDFQITISSRNPNRMIGVHYDQLGVYATYCERWITFSTGIPHTYQAPGKVNIWSPFIHGTSVPIAPINAVSQVDGQRHGGVALMIRVEGRVRWNFWFVTRGEYRLTVECPAFINIGNKAAGVPISDEADRYTLVIDCSISV